MAVTSESLSPFQRRAIPGLADLLFVVLFVAGIAPRLFVDGDTGWHLWAGAEALARGPGMLADTLSYTRAGSPWRDVQWLGDALLAAAHRHAGYFGVAVLVSFVFAATHAWLYRILRAATDHPPAAALVMLLVARIAGLHLLARPLVFVFPLVVAAWELVRRPGLERRAVWLLPALTVVWANVHPTAFLAPALAVFGAAVLGRGRALWLAAALSAIALGATPWGFGWLAEALPSAAGSSLLARIDEWRAPDFAEPRFAVVLVGVLLALAARPAGRPLGRGERLLGIVCLAAALRSARLAPIAAILWAPRLADDLASWARVAGGGLPGRAWRALQEGLAPFERAWKPGFWVAAIGVLMLAAAPRLAPLWPGVSAGFPASRFPSRAMAEAARLGLGPRVFASYEWGGYVGFEHGARWKVFVDGRMGFFGGPILRDYLAAVDVGPGWLAALERARPDWVLMPPGAALVPAAPLTGRWRVAWSDPVAVILTPVAP